MTVDIDQQVAAFRDEMSGLAAVDLEAVTREAATLAHALATASTDSDASKALLAFVGAGKDHPGYTAVVAMQAMTQVAMYAVCETPTFALSDFLGRFRTLILAARAMNITKEATA